MAIDFLDLYWREDSNGREDNFVVPFYNYSLVKDLKLTFRLCNLETSQILEHNPKRYIQNICNICEFWSIQFDS